MMISAPFRPHIYHNEQKLATYGKGVEADFDRAVYIHTQEHSISRLNISKRGEDKCGVYCHR
jgi:hypothetical protein